MKPKFYFSEDEQRTISIDFDGVIHNDSLGWHDGTIYGEPIPGSLESVKKLADNYKLVLFTAKAKPDRPLVDGKTGTELVWEWLEKYGIKDCFYEITAEKPRCLFYVDDKAIRFIDWEKALEDIENFK
jgi:ribonucleotide monophosphatase NagD (HAD superfamily)